MHHKTGIHFAAIALLFVGIADRSVIYAVDVQVEMMAAVIRAHIDPHHITGFGCSSLPCCAHHRLPGCAIDNRPQANLTGRRLAEKQIAICRRRSGIHHQSRTTFAYTWSIGSSTPFILNANRIFLGVIDCHKIPGLGGRGVCQLAIHNLKLRAGDPIRSQC